MVLNLDIRPISVREYETVRSLEEDRSGCGYLSAVFVRQTMTISPRSCLAAWAGGDYLAGYIASMQLSDDHATAWILRIRVRDELRRQGVGTALLHHAHGVLRDMGTSQVLLSCSPSNEGALALYAHTGYRITRCETGYFGPGEDRYILSRSLVT